ncbi:6871_t:CDS:2 [Funneliformis mosseae]|uniref:6871_t:CDS:1 n=1 Tax=Funneliformis mosseae TaxID=27381 RepID=A0A9N9DLK7_FUNMO|nr:6871_t:CDS:2 [Funneliformis mosseae]
MSEGLTVGIDLGTSYSCVGVWNNDRVDIIANDQGNRTTPSFVTFTDKERFIGDAAKNLIAINTYSTVFSTKCLIGRNFYDKDVQRYIKHWPFKTFNTNGRPFVQVDYKGEERNFTTEEILSMILIKIKEFAEDSLCKKVKSAVITSPAYFNASQRQALKDAGTIAGLHVLRIISDPSAAAIAYYGLDKKIVGEQNVLILDFGGGTFEATLLTIKDGIFEVKATACDTHLGGEYFDYRLVDYFVQEFERNYKSDLSKDARALCRLKNACERAKRSLSTSKKTFISIDSLFEDIDFHSSLTRTKFEKLNRDLFKSTIKLIERVLRDAKLYKGRVHEIVLVGGSTRIPKIQNMVSEFFNGKTPNKSINPDEAVANGAAVYAAMLSGDTSENIQDLNLIDVNADFGLSIGIKATDGAMKPIIKSNDSLPIRRTVIISTYFDNQSEIPIKIYEGKYACTINNNFLAEFELSGIPPAPKGTPQVEVTFDIDVNCTLKVSAVDKRIGRPNMLTITIDDGRLSREEVERMIAEVEEYRVEEEKVAQKLQARNELESCAHSLRNKLKELEVAIQESIMWLENNQEADKDEYVKQQKSLDAIANLTATRLCLKTTEEGEQTIEVD